jgi:hypothetical protein
VAVACAAADGRRGPVQTSSSGHHASREPMYVAVPSGAAPMGPSVQGGRATRAGYQAAYDRTPTLGHVAAILVVVASRQRWSAAPADWPGSFARSYGIGRRPIGQALKLRREFLTGAR